MAIERIGPTHHRQLQDTANVLASAKRIVVVTGAGISTGAGIPDFRSKGGLYSLINSDYNARISPSAAASSIKGKDLFDSSLWRDDVSTSVFYTFTASLRRKIREQVKETTATHQFIRQLRDQRKLVRCYTQNIDGLEATEGMVNDLTRGKGSPGRFTKKAIQSSIGLAGHSPGSRIDGGCEVVELHGNLMKDLRCTLCKTVSKWEDGIEDTFLRGDAPECPACRLQDAIRRAQGKRGSAVGSLRPNITLYGEEHPSSHLISQITTQDLRSSPDLLLIMGTSLKVFGVKKLVKEFSKHVHARKRGKVIFVNRTKPPESVFAGVIDSWVSMDCDDFVGELRLRRPDLFQAQGRLQLPTTKLLTVSGKNVTKPGEKAVEGQKHHVDDTEDEKENRGCIRPVKEIRTPSAQRRIKIIKTPVSRSTSGTNLIPRLVSESLSQTPRTPSQQKQLPTPPPSRTRAVTPSTSRKKAGSGFTSTSPFKRRKLGNELRIWSDHESDALSAVEDDPEDGLSKPGGSTKMSRIEVLAPFVYQIEEGMNRKRKRP